MAAAVTLQTLTSGHVMPSVGLGVWRAEPNLLENLVREAVKLGYRHFDCAADYKNEGEVGEALKAVLSEGLVKRNELFITTKLWNSDHAHVKDACQDSLAKLGVSYLDLYLVHFPIATRHTGVGTTDSALGEDKVLDIDCSVPLHQVWRDMEGLVESGLVRSIGISNYDIYLTRDCLAYAKIKPAVNQIETHPYFQRESLVKFCQKHSIVVTAHTPLGGGQANKEWFNSKSPLEDPVIKPPGCTESQQDCKLYISFSPRFSKLEYLAMALQEIGGKYNKTSGQVMLRWGIQRNTIVIPKSSRVERLKENIEVFDFELSEDDMSKLATLDAKLRSNNPAAFWGIDLYA